MSQATEKTTDFDHPIRDEDIQAARLLVGVDAPKSIDGFYAVATSDALRNFTRAYGDDNPLDTDPDYGRSTRWGSASGTAT